MHRGSILFTIVSLSSLGAWAAPAPLFPLDYGASNVVPLHNPTPEEVANVDYWSCLDEWFTVRLSNDHLPQLHSRGIHPPSTPIKPPTFTHPTTSTY